jgi:restriction system protein
VTTAWRRRPTRRRPRIQFTWASVAIGAFVVYAAVTHLLVTLGVLGGLAAAAIGVRSLRRAWRRSGRVARPRPRFVPARPRVRFRFTAATNYLAMDPTQFEHAVADLCRRDGCRDVQVVGGGGDLSADVLATMPDGRRLLVQCKRYALTKPVDSGEVQKVNGTYRDIHRCRAAIVVTTNRYTRDAVDLAHRVGIRLVDGAALQTWTAGGPPPWQ